MTDKETIVMLCEKLNLKKVKTIEWLDSYEYCFIDNSIYIGAGDGYKGFNVQFDFDDLGNIISHCVWE